MKIIFATKIKVPIVIKLTTIIFLILYLKSGNSLSINIHSFSSIFFISRVTFRFDLKGITCKNNARNENSNELANNII